MDYCYTTEPGNEDVYHVLYKCGGAKAIKKENRVKARPPDSQARKPCKDCLGIIGSWLAEANAEAQATGRSEPQTGTQTGPQTQNGPLIAHG